MTRRFRTLRGHFRIKEKFYTCNEVLLFSKDFSSSCSARVVNADKNVLLAGRHTACRREKRDWVNSVCILRTYSQGLRKCKTLSPTPFVFLPCALDAEGAARLKCKEDCDSLRTSTVWCITIGYSESASISQEYSPPSSWLMDISLRLVPCSSTLSSRLTFMAPAVSTRVPFFQIRIMGPKSLTLHGNSKDEPRPARKTCKAWDTSQVGALLFPATDLQYRNTNGKSW